MHDHDQWHRADDGNRREALLDVERNGLAEERGIDRMAGDGTHQQRVAVGRTVGHHAGADAAGGAGAIVDCDLLPQFGGKLLCHGAPDDVCRAARRIGNHQPDRLDRICRRQDRLHRLRQTRSRAEQQARGKRPGKHRQK
jgi:hypothetical protein